MLFGYLLSTQSRGSACNTVRHRTRVLARQLEVRMLVIDEIHSMLAGTFREQRILRFFRNRNIPMNYLNSAVMGAA
jgi:hypothetical protein